MKKVIYLYNSLKRFLIFKKFQISMAIASAFGRDTAAAQWTVDFLLGKINSNLSVWSAEEQLMNDSLQLFVALVENKQR